MIRWVPLGSWPRVSIDPNMESAEGWIPVDAAELTGAQVGDGVIAFEVESEASALARVVRLGELVGLIRVDWTTLRDDPVRTTYSSASTSVSIIPPADSLFGTSGTTVGIALAASMV